MRSFAYVKDDVLHRFNADEIYVEGTMVRLVKDSCEVAVINLGPGDVVYQTEEC